MTLSMINMSVDAGYKFEYNRVINKYRQRTVLVGPQTWQTLTVCPSSLTLTDLNAKHVNLSTGNDSTGDGTAANPYLTMKKAASECTSSMPYVYVTCTPASIQVVGDYPYPTTYDADFQGCFALSGKTVQWTDRELGYTPDDTNSIFVATTGTAGGAGTAADPINTITHAITHCDASHQKIVIMDSGSYDESAFTFTGNFLGLYAASGFAPTITINQNVSSTTYSPFTIASTELDDAVTVTDTHIARLDDDSVVHAWLLSGGTGYFAIVRNNGYVYKAKTAFSGAGTCNAIYSVVVLPISNNIVIIFLDNSNDLRMIIYDKTGTSVKASTVVQAGTIVAASAAAFSDDNWVVCWCDSAASYAYSFATFDSTGTAVVTATYIATGSSSHYSICAAVKSNDNVIFSLSDTSAKLRIDIYYEDGIKIKSYLSSISVSSGKLVMRGGSTIVLSDDSYIVGISIDAYLYLVKFDINDNLIKYLIHSLNDSSSADIRYYSINKLANDNISIIDSDYTASNIYLTIYSEELVTSYQELKKRQVLANKSYISSIVNSLGEIIFSYIDTSTADLFYARVSNYYFIGCAVSAAATINGITFDCENQEYMRYLFAGASNLTRKYCEIKNMSSTYYDEYTNLSPQNVSLLTGALDRRNEYIHDVVNGDNVTNAVAKSYNCIFLNSTGIDFTVAGTASSHGDIAYIRNAAVNCAGGFYITNNSGTNDYCGYSIFYNISGYCVSAYNTITVLNSVLFDESNNITESSCISLNPLFLNSGELGSEYANLDIQSTAMGDVFSSPCINTGEGGTTDIGPYQTLRIGPADTWTSFTVSGKPRTKITRDIKFAGSSKAQLSDGSYTSGVDGCGEVITLNHDQKNAMTRTEFENWLTMMLSGKQDVRFYPNPTTYASTYFDVTIFFEDTAAYAPAYSLDNDYKASVKYSFAYKLTA